MTTCTTRQTPLWQSHKYTESTDSETSFFDMSTSASTTADSWSGYFENWESDTRDSYCPEIVSASNSPTRSHQSEATPTCGEEGLLPSACLQRKRPATMPESFTHQTHRASTRKSKRYGIVPYSDPDAGDHAVTRLNTLLHDTMSDTEDILAAMYSADWDATSLQRWYEQSQKSPADLALFKIMFTLRYTFDETSPISSR